MKAQIKTILLPDGTIWTGVVKVFPKTRRVARNRQKRVPVAQSGIVSIVREEKETQ